jgi:pimeloyl-ACP methyl ester carboxylesterase
LLQRAGRQVLAPDLRGHGRSPKFYDPAAYVLALLGGDVVSLLDTVSIGRTDMVGYSMGARIGAWLAVHHPERVGALVLGGIGLRLVEGTADAEVIARAVEAEDPTAVSPTPEKVFRRYAESTGSDLKALAASIRGQVDTIPASDLAAIAAPTLVIAGSNDPLARGASELAGMIPGARHLAIDGQDHMRAVGHPAFKRAVMDFLADGT